ncbi:MAG: hypothetical protein AAF517_07250 [Planctomycetota bacterium]
MKFRSLLFCVLGLFATTVSYAADREVRIEMDLFRMRGSISGSTSLTEDIWAGLKNQKPNAVQGPFVFFTKSELTIGDLPPDLFKRLGWDTVKLEADLDGWKWNGKKNPPKNSALQLLSRPYVQIGVGNAFEISVQATDPIEYFEKQKNGHFVHKKSDKSAGMWIKAKVRQGPGDRVILEKLGLKIQVLKSRKEIPGVGLDVGEPVFAGDELETQMSLRPNIYYGVQIRSEDEGMYLLRVRVTEAKKAKDGKAPSSRQSSSRQSSSKQSSSKQSSSKQSSKKKDKGEKTDVRKPQDVLRF